jgi:NAD(P)-dependent dehydrogenase (short-subunit alcohol dehydrogenase family)
MAIKKNEALLSSADSVSLKGKMTLVTGAASGIGKAVSWRFADSGSDLMLVDIDEKGLKKVKDDLASFNIKIQTFAADLSNKTIIDNLWNNLNGIIPEILVNNSGIYPSKNYLEIDQGFYDRVLDVNLASVFWMCQNFIKARKNQGGIIVNTSSIEAVVPFKDEMAHYSVSKSGVYALTRSLAHDYGRKGFRVNGVIPGVVRTPGIDNQIKMAVRKMDLNLFKTGLNYKSRLALGRLGKPDEIAKVILFLCSDLASYVQGVMVPVDGGFLCS